MTEHKISAHRTYISKNTLGYFVLVLLCMLLSLFTIFDNVYFQLIPIMILVFVVFILLTLRFPFLGLLIYSTFFFIRPQEFVGILMSIPIPLERIVAIVMIITMILKIKKGSFFKVNLTTIHYSLAAFIGVAGLSVIFSIWISGAYHSWYNLFTLFIVFFLISQFIKNKKHLKYYIFFIIISTAFHAISAIINYYNGIYIVDMGIDRAFAMDLSYGSPNSLAATIVITLPLYYYYYKATKSKMIKIFLFLITLSSLWCIILTGSRTGIKANLP